MPNLNLGPVPLVRLRGVLIRNLANNRSEEYFKPRLLINNNYQQRWRILFVQRGIIIS